MKLFIYMLLLFTVNATYAQSSPSEVVTVALNALTNGNIEKLLEVTEQAELKQAKELMIMMNNASKKESILNEYKNLKSWSIESEEMHNINNRKLAVVSTKWTVIIPLESNPKSMVKNTFKEQDMYVDYMLEQFNGQWKIISRKAQS